MRIKGWHVDGFGIFRDFEVKDLARGLTVFQGPNEAGKTTLLAFLRGMLFGFPEGDRGRSYYPPAKGRKHGGRLVIETPQGDVAIERRIGRLAPPRVTLADGRPGTETDLRRILGGVNERLYRSVFAFSLTELQAFESLSAADVREHLFSAAITGAGRFARTAIRGLESDAEALLPAKGASRLQELAEELAEIRERISRTRKSLARYPDLLTREHQALARVDEMEERIKEQLVEAGKKELLMEIWPIHCEIERHLRELAELEPIERFPAEAEARRVAIEERTEAARAELETLRAERVRVEEQRGEIAAALNRRLASLDDPIDRQYESLGVHRQRFQQLTDSADQLERLETSLAESLRALGSGWDEARLLAFRDEAKRFEEAQAWEARLATGRRRLRDVRAAFAAQNAVVDRKTSERERLARELMRVEPPAEARLAEWERASPRLRANFSEVRAEEAALESSERLVSEADEALDEVRAAHVRQTPVGVVVAFILAALGGGGAMLWRLGASDVPGTVAFGTLAVLALFGVVVSAVQLRQTRRLERSRREDERKRARVAAALRENAWRHGERLRELRVKVAEDSALLQIGGEISFASIEQKDWELRRAREDRRDFDEKTAALEIVEQELRAAREEEDRRVAAITAEEGAHRDLGLAWRSWKRDHGLATGLDPEQVFAVLNRIALSRKTLLELRAVRELRVSVEKKTAVWEEETRRLLRATGDAASAEMRGGGLVARFLTLHERSLGDRDVRRRLQLIDRQLEERAGWIAGKDAQLRAAERDRRALFDEAGASDTEDFHARLRVFLRRQELHRLRAEGESRLRSRLGETEQAIILRDKLEKGSLDGWKREHQEIQHRIGRMHHERDEAIRAHRDAERERRALEDATELADLELEERGIVAELEEAAGEWRVATLTSGLLDETLDEFERTRQPRVIAEASRIFASVTEGRYVELRQAEDEDDLIAVERGGKRKLTSALSRGTAEQLYLALRLALLDEYARGNLALPIVMDDVLVNFDPRRAEAMGRTLCEFCREHQVLLFTCQPQTGELLGRLDGATQLRHLAGSADSDESRRVG